KGLQVQAIFLLFLQVFSCSDKVNVSGPSSENGISKPSPNSRVISNLRVQTHEEAFSVKAPQIGVYFMPSWDFSSKEGTKKDIYWACLQGKEDCPFLKDPALWGTRGRIYNSNYPYEGPYLDRKPHQSLNGFYNRIDPELVKKQLEYMKSYGIDFFAYNWYFG